MSAVETVRNIYAAYSRGDLDGSLSYCSDDICFTWVAEPNLVAFAGRCENKQDLRRRMIELHDVYEYRSFTPVDIFGGGDRVAAQTVLELTRRDNGKAFTLRCCDIWTVRNGVATEMVEYYDTGLLAAMDQS